MTDTIVNGKLIQQVILTDTDGNPYVAGSSSGGATAALQTAGNASLTSIDGKLTNAATTALQTSGNSSLTSIDNKVTGLGATNDAAASSDTGTFSLIALFKRLLGKIPVLGNAVMASSTPVTIASNDTQFAALLAKFSTNSYPTGSTAVSAASGNVANAAATATLPATASVTNYVTGVRVSGLGATAGGGAGLTLSGLLGGNYIHYFNVPTGVGVAFMFNIEFPFPIPASAVNTAIIASVGALGTGNTNCNVSISGFRA